MYLYNVGAKKFLSVGGMWGTHATLDVTPYSIYMYWNSSSGTYFLESKVKGSKNMPCLDIGTCVLPHADVKVYLTASVETRAKRRYQELQEKGEDCNLEEIAHDIEERDHRDMTRETAPLKQAEDAVLVDSSDMTIAEVVKTIVDLCR